MIDIECGPVSDLRRFKLTLPAKPLTLGVFVSGGIDSAILYYMMLKINQEVGNIHTIIPYTILRKEGSRLFAEPVIKYVSGLFDTTAHLSIVGDNTLSEEDQVRSGVNQVLQTTKTDIVYVGVIEQLSQHMTGWSPIPSKQGIKFRTPLSYLNKSHIIDLVYKLRQEHLLEITHSCIHEVGRCNICNGCNERSWAFAQLGIEDIGKV